MMMLIIKVKQHRRTKVFLASFGHKNIQKAVSEANAANITETNFNSLRKALQYFSAFRNF